MTGYRDDEPIFGSAEWRQVNKPLLVSLAIADVLICVLLAVILFGPAAMGGFNPVAVAIYSALIVSAAASIYIVVRRRQLARSGARWILVAAIVALLGAISPMVASFIVHIS